MHRSYSTACWEQKRLLPVLLLSLHLPNPPVKEDVWVGSLPRLWISMCCRHAGPPGQTTTQQPPRVQTGLPPIFKFDLIESCSCFGVSIEEPNSGSATRPGQTRVIAHLAYHSFSVTCFSVLSSQFLYLRLKVLFKAFTQRGNSGQI